MPYPHQTDKKEPGQKGGPVEILSPAGSLDILKCAFAAGADAVYAGGACFGARAFAQNFTEEELLEGIDYAHIHGKKLYLTVNTLVKEREFDQLYNYLLPFYRQGLDAVIVQDMGVMEFIREQFPHLPIHASTQMTVTNAISASFLEQKGVTRVVPAREISLGEIRQISDRTDLEIECFVHGALCYCYSGRCLMSSMIGGRSGNRGQCAQPCRLPWRAEHDRKERDLLSLKDLCAIDLIPDLVRAGITSFKIEGRMKQPSYVETVTAMYRKYTDLYDSLKEGKQDDFRVSAEDRRILMEAYQRRGYTDGYYTRHNGREMLSLNRPAQAQKKETAVKTGKEQPLQKKINGKLILSPGKSATLILSAALTGGHAEVTVTGDTVQEALSRPLSREQLQKQLQKTGNTEFAFQDLDIRTEGDIFLPLQSLNALRRAGLEKLKDRITGSFRRTDDVQKVSCIPCSAPSKERPLGEIPLFVAAMSAEQAWAALSIPTVKRIYLSDTVWAQGGAQELLDKARSQQVEVYVSMAEIYRREAEDFYGKHLDAIARNFDGAMVKNLESFLLLKEKGFSKPVDTGASAYAWNRRSCAFWRDLGADFMEAPLELNAQELGDLDRSRMILPVYGYLPVMVSAGCIRKHTKACTRKAGWTSVTDRYHKKFMVRSECLYCYNILYNPDPLVLFGQEKEIRALAPGALLCGFTWESGERTREVLEMFRKWLCGGQTPQWEEGFTRGHFKRGVK